MNDLLERLKHHIIPSEHNAYHPHFLRRSWLVFFFALILVAEGFLITNLVARQSSETFLAAVVPGEILALTNTERQQNNLGALTENSELDQAAQAKAEDMATKGYFSHISPSGETPWTWIEDAGYSYHYAGENLATQFVDSRAVVNAWMASPTHRANLLGPQYTNIGIGVAQGIYQGQPTIFVVQFFASPFSTSTTKSLSQSASIFKAAGQGIIQWVAHLEAEPVMVTDWTLGVIASIIILVLVLTFVIHIQIQPMQMLLTGATLTGFTLFLIWSNGTFFPIASVIDSQAAAVVLSSTLGASGGLSPSATTTATTTGQ